MVVRVTGDHNHVTDLISKVASSNEEEAVKIAAQMPNVLTRTVQAILKQHLQNTELDSVNYLSKIKAFSRKVQRKRNKI